MSCKVRKKMTQLIVQPYGVAIILVTNRSYEDSFRKESAFRAARLPLQLMFVPEAKPLSA